MRSRLWACIAAVLFMGEGQAAEISQHTVGNWRISDFTDDDTGRFSYCSGAAKNKSAEDIFFTVTKNSQWNLVFNYPGYPLTEGVYYNILLSVDGAPVSINRAVGIAGFSTLGPLPDAPAVFERLRNGHTLEATVAGHSFAFDLAGIDAALASLTQCLQSHGGQDSAVPAGGAPPLVPRAPDSMPVDEGRN